MLFNTPVFILFFVLAVPASFLVPKRFQNLLLLFASYFFYGFGEPSLILLLMAVTAATYISARGICRHPARKKLWKVLGILIPLLALFLFKYLGFFTRLVGGLLGGNGSGAALALILPTGISFYTFQAVSYVIDVSRGDMDCEDNPVTFALYLSFFPQLVAGPIERAKDLLPQFRRERHFAPASAIRGARLMLFGFFEKIAIADILGIFVNRIWADPAAAGGADILLAIFFFSIQILCDFKGYSDIARGAAAVLGIRLSVNFDEPYRSASVSEFWRRWHMTLSSWLRDYLYIPLGGSARGDAIWCRNILIVFLISGLWHGADLTFVAWGLLHALFQILEYFLFRGKARDTHRGLRQILTFLLVSAAWILFRAPDFSTAGLFITRLFTGWQTLSVTAEAGELACFAAALLGFACLSRLPLLLSGEGTPKKVLRYLGYTLMLWLTLAAYLYLRSGGIQSSFIYFQF